MFTGIVNGTAILSSIIKKKQLYTYVLRFPLKLLNNLKIGHSIANNGCCLTVTKIKNNYVFFDILKETLRVTNLSYLSLNTLINIERSLKFGDELGGHLMSGHIMSTANILKIQVCENNVKMYFKINNPMVMKYIFLKGFIAVDGVSLTVYKIYKNIFSVYLIPETMFSTNFKNKVVGDIVNIEVDYYTQIIIDKLEQYHKNKTIEQ